MIYINVQILLWNVDIQIGDNVYCLTNEYEARLDYFLLENENTVYRISDSYRNCPDNTQITVNVNQIISKVMLLNEHIALQRMTISTFRHQS